MHHHAVLAGNPKAVASGRTMSTVHATVYRAVFFVVKQHHSRWVALFDKQVMFPEVARLKRKPEMFEFGFGHKKAATKRACASLVRQDRITINIRYPLRPVDAQVAHRVRQVIRVIVAAHALYSIDFEFVSRWCNDCLQQLTSDSFWSCDQGNETRNCGQQEESSRCPLMLFSPKLFS